MFVPQFSCDEVIKYVPYCIYKSQAENLLTAVSSCVLPFCLLGLCPSL